MRPPREPPVSRNSRKVNTRPRFRSVLILCEGKTEQLYFEGLIERHQLNGVEIEPGISLALTLIGEQGTTTAIVKEAISRYETAKERGTAYDDIWCVFDYDGFASFDEAVDKCTLWHKQHPYLKAAWSNESFELWYVLHFQYLDTVPKRPQKGKKASGGTVTARSYYKDALEASFKKEPAVYPESDYSKVEPTMYKLLYPLRATAIRNAKKLLTSSVHSGKTKKSEMTPATTVHERVCALLLSTPDAVLCGAAETILPPTLEQQAARAGMMPAEYARETGSESAT